MRLHGANLERTQNRWMRTRSAEGCEQVGTASSSSGLLETVGALGSGDPGVIRTGRCSPNQRKRSCRKWIGVIEQTSAPADGYELTARLVDRYSASAPTGPCSGKGLGVCERPVRRTRRDTGMLVPTDHHGVAGCAGGHRKGAQAWISFTAPGTSIDDGFIVLFRLRDESRPEW